MTINRARCGAGAFTLIELLCVLAIIGILAALLLPALNKAAAQAKRVQCVSQLRQMGIAFQNFAQDHNGQFPMSLPASAGGTMELARNAYGIAGEFYFSFRYFQVLSNELLTPKLLICPADMRQPAPNFPTLGNQGISYFVGISAVPASPNSILAGDRNLTNDWAKPTTLLHFGPNNSLRWTAELHRFKGDLLFADGRVEERNTPGLVMNGDQATPLTDLALPTVPNSSMAAAPGQGPVSTPPALASPEAVLLATTASKPALQNQASNAAGAVQSRPNADSATSPGWRTSFSSSQSQPDSPLTQANLQPGTGSNSFITNMALSLSKPEDPGFSLFPPLLGQGGMLQSSAGKWALLVLVLLLLAGFGLLFRWRLARNQLLRKRSRDIDQLL